MTRPVVLHRVQFWLVLARSDSLMTLQKRRAAQQNRPSGQVFINRPFLQRPCETLSKVDLGFLKGHTPPAEPDSPGREQSFPRVPGPIYGSPGSLATATKKTPTLRRRDIGARGL
jgi:hypothetical protein